MRRFQTLMLCAVCAIVATPFSQVSAEKGDIIISRDVQPRTATRAPLVPDPNPLVSNPGAIARDAAMELSDSDFAAIATGATLRNNANSPAVVPAQFDRVQQQQMPGAATGQRAGGTGGSNSNAISNRVGSSLQQGLRPLQQLGGQ
jgi:hypothetical protein